MKIAALFNAPHSSVLVIILLIALTLSYFQGVGSIYCNNASVAMQMNALKPWVSINSASYKFNLINFRIPKTATSTTGGIIRNLGQKYNYYCWRSNRWKKTDPEPRIWTEHIRTHRLMSTLRTNTALPSFFLTFIRDPLERCLSEFYHLIIDRKAVNATTDSAKIAHLNGSFTCSDTQFDYIGIHPLKENATELYRNNFDFIGLVERYDESIVALKHILNTTLCDVIYLNKANVGQEGAMDVGAKKKRAHSHISISEDSQAVKDYLNSGYFLKKNSFDLELIRLANEKLDEFINLIGFEKFQLSLKNFNFLRSETSRVCLNSTDTSDRSCIFSDQGCFYNCYNRVCPPLELAL